MDVACDLQAVPLPKSIAAVERGQADVLPFRQAGDQLAEIETRYASQLHVAPSLSTFYVFLNTRVPPFDDVRVRRAVNYAIDRSGIVQAVGGPERAQPSCQILPPGIAGYVPYCPYTLHPGSGAWSSPDRARARRLLRGVRRQRVTVWWPVVLLPTAAGQELVRALEALGFPARLKVAKDLQKYFAQAGDPKRRIQAGGGGWIADYPAAGSFFLPLLTCATANAPMTSNAAFFCDTNVDRTIAHANAVQARDTAGARLLWAKVDRQIVDRAPWISLDNPRASTFVSARVGNFQSNPQWGVLLDQLWVR